MSASSHHVSRNDGYSGAGVTLTPRNGPSTGTLIFLHGLGDTGDGWASGFPVQRFPTIKFIFPTAPTRPITLNGGFPMPGWFDIRGLEETSPEDTEGFAEAKARIDAIIKGELDKGIKAERIVLGGFSQGGAVTLHTALRSDVKFGGAVILSGWLAFQKEYPQALTDIGRSVGFWAGHGDADGIVRYSWGKHSAEKVKGMGVSYDFHTYSGLDHGATGQEIDDVTAFLRKVWE